MFSLIFLMSVPFFAQSLPKSFEPQGDGLLGNCRYAAQYWDGASVAPNEFGLALGCIGVVRGVADTLQYFSIVKFPPDMNPDEPVRVVIRYLQDHPKELDERDTLLVVRALRNAFPRKVGKAH